MFRLHPLSQPFLADLLEIVSLELALRSEEERARSTFGPFAVFKRFELKRADVVRNLRKTIARDCVAFRFAPWISRFIDKNRKIFAHGASLKKKMPGETPGHRRPFANERPIALCRIPEWQNKYIMQAYKIQTYVRDLYVKFYAMTAFRRYPGCKRMSVTSCALHSLFASFQRTIVR